jgi:short-subunit dehydrogenase
MNKTALITGATSGILEAVSDAFAKEKFRLILTG